MNEVKKCPKCKGEMEWRHIRGYGFRDLAISVGRFSSAEEKVTASVCKRCGYIELYKEMKEDVKP